MDKVKSTNDYSINLIKKNISTEGIVISDIQTKGRGTYGNKWISNVGNIFCSIYKIVKNRKCIHDAQFNSLIVVRKYLKKIGVQKKKIKVKPPNDILIDNKKICGILVESIKYKNKLYLMQCCFSKKILGAILKVTTFILFCIIMQLHGEF